MTFVRSEHEYAAARASTPNYNKINERRRPTHDTWNIPRFVTLLLAKKLLCFGAEFGRFHSWEQTDELDVSTNGPLDELGSILFCRSTICIAISAGNWCRLWQEVSVEKANVSSRWLPNQANGCRLVYETTNGFAAGISFSLFLIFSLKSSWTHWRPSLRAGEVELLISQRVIGLLRAYHSSHSLHANLCLYQNSTKFTDERTKYWEDKSSNVGPLHLIRVWPWEKSNFQIINS